MIQCRILYNRKPILIKYYPVCANFTYWLHKLVGELNYIPKSISNQGIWLKMEIKTVEKAMVIEQLALCQWGYKGVKVVGERPPLEVNDPMNFAWPDNLFPHDFRRNGPHPIISKYETVKDPIPAPVKNKEERKALKKHKLF